MQSLIVLSGDFNGEARRRIGTHRRFSIHWQSFRPATGLSKVAKQYSRKLALRSGLYGLSPRVHSRGLSCEGHEKQYQAGGGKTCGLRISVQASSGSGYRTGRVSKLFSRSARRRSGWRKESGEVDRGGVISND